MSLVLVEDCSRMGGRPPIFQSVFKPQFFLDDCSCRKPKIGLVEKAAAELGFDPEVSFVIGDKPCDTDMGRNMGATTLVVRTGYGAKFAAENATQPDYIAEALRKAASILRRLLANGEGT